MCYFFPKVVNGNMCAKVVASALKHFLDYRRQTSRLLKRMSEGMITRGPRVKAHKKNKTKGKKKQGLNHPVKGLRRRQGAGEVERTRASQRRQLSQISERARKPLTSFRNEEWLEMSSGNHLELNHLNSEQLMTMFSFTAKSPSDLRPTLNAWTGSRRKLLGCFYTDNESEV